MDRTEVTVAAYRACVQAGGCEAAPTTVHWQGVSSAHERLWNPHCNAARQAVDNHPINCVDWTQADAYCRWRGGRLPTEAEWESAARGSTGTLYPWGNEAPNATRVNGLDRTGDDLLRAAPMEVSMTLLDTDSDGWGTTAPVGSFPTGASSLGLFDLAGNVWEWTADVYGRYEAARVDAPTGVGGGPYRVRRGGGWETNHADALRTTVRSRSAQSYRSVFVGFRCARTLDTQTAPSLTTPPVPSATPHDALLREAVLEGLARNDPGMGQPWLRQPLSIMAGPWVLQARAVLSPTVAALVEAPALGNGTDRCTWLVSAALEAPEMRPRWMELGCGARRPTIAEVLVRDVDANGSDALVILSRPSSTPDATAPPNVDVYAPDFDVGTPTWVSLTTVQWEIDGSRDAASVDAALASRGRDAALSEGTSPVRLVARLARATPAGFRAMIDARGLRMCNQSRGQGRAPCRTVPVARLDDAQVIALQQRYFALQLRSGTDRPGFALGPCRQGPRSTTCAGGEYTGNLTLRWTITGVGASMRLAAVEQRSIGN